MAHVAKWKKEEVAELVKLLTESPVIAVANVDGIPSAQMQMMRKQLRSDARVKISKNTLLTLALKEAAKDKPGIDQLVTNIDGSTALIMTKMSPFRVFKTLEASKTKAPARGGEVAPEDIRVEKGETQFKPGPIVGELQKAGIPAKIDNGKVMIAQNKLLVKKGDRIPQDVAQMLTRLEIFPLVVGMNLKAVFDKGTVYGTAALSVDYLGQIATAHSQAINLAVFAGWAEKGTVEPLVAVSHARMLAIAALAAGKNPDAVDAELKDAIANRAAAAAAVPAAAAKPAEEEKPEEKGPSEEEAMAGLGSLFG